MKTYYYIRLADCDALMSLDDDFKFRCIKDTDIDFPERGKEYEFLSKHLCDDNWKKYGKLSHSVFANLVIHNQIIAQVEMEE